MNLLSDYSLQPHNTFGVDVHCQTFTEIDSVDELRDVLQRPALFAGGLTILGEGSNVLFLDDIPGLVLKINIYGREVARETDDEIWLRIGAGENWQTVVQYCVERNWGGIENLAGIPGRMGAAPVQNIGAYGVEVSEVLQQVEAVELPTGRPLNFSAEECALTYRGSIFKRTWKGRAAITQVTLRLKKHPQPRLGYMALDEELGKIGHGDYSIRYLYEAVLRIRREKLPDPASIGNAGSFFKNPELPSDHVENLKKRIPGLVAFPAGTGRMKVAAGQLIDHAGWKGLHRGRCGVHERQALVLVNFGGASGREIFELSEEIRKSVRDTFGIDLEREVVVMGGNRGKNSGLDL